MNLIIVDDRQTWEAFQTSQAYAQFLQAWAWGELRVAQQHVVRRFALVDDSGAWVSAIQMEYRRKLFGVGYWFAPRGPVFAHQLEPAARRNVMLVLCQQLLRQPELRHKTLFWRLEPVAPGAAPEGLLPLSFYRIDALNPASTRLIDLAPAQTDILRGMHEKTRYNIHLAERHEVTVRVDTQPQDLEKFLDLMDETARRDGFIQHPRAYIAQMYQALKTQGLAHIRLAEQAGRVLAASIEITYGDTCTYLHGASSSENRQLMAPYLLHWTAIKDAKTRGFRYYDLWGVNPEFKSMFYYKPSWDGITRFKRGFGGSQLDLVGTWDLPFHVYLYRLAYLKYFFRG